MAETPTGTATHRQENQPAHGQSHFPRVIMIFPQLTEEEKQRPREDITRQLLALTEGHK